MKRQRLLSLLLFIISASSYLLGQPVQQYVQVIVAPERADWTYKTGETARFNISVFKDGVPLKDAIVSYEIGPEKQKPTKTETKTLTNGTLTVDGGTLRVAGFVRCIAKAEVNGVTYRGLGTAGFDPGKIMPTVENPSDFDQFWDKAKKSFPLFRSTQG